MKKTIILVFSIVALAMLFGVSGNVMAASSIVVAQDVPPRMMNPHGDDSDAGLQYMANFFDGLHQLKGVDMNVHSLTFRYPNTRGFTGEANMRMNQIIDGIENIPPGLSFSAGNIFGVSQLDIDNVELLVGACCIKCQG